MEKASKAGGGAIHYAPGAPRARGRNMDHYRSVLRNFDRLSKNERCGYTGERSPLLDLPGLDLFRDVPLDPMHQIGLGIVKKLFLCTFKVPDTSSAKFERVDMSVLSAKWTALRLPSDFGRRSRPIIYAQYKASEWVHLCIYAPQLILDCLPNPCQSYVSKVWCIAISLVRIYFKPSPDYEQFVNRPGMRARLQRLHRQFHKLFAEVFGNQACSYNVHVFKHWVKFRDRKPLTEQSAFKYESSYAKLRSHYDPRTMSTGLQALEGFYKSCKFGEHRCKRRLRLKTAVTPKRDDTLVYLKKSHGLLKLVDVSEPGYVRAIKLLTGRIEPGDPHLYQLPFTSIVLGMWEVLDDPLLPNTETVRVPVEDIGGKVVMVGDVANLVPLAVLLEHR